MTFAEFTETWQNTKVVWLLGIPQVWQYSDNSQKITCVNFLLPVLPISYLFFHSFTYVTFLLPLLPLSYQCYLFVTSLLAVLHISWKSLQQVFWVAQSLLQVQGGSCMECGGSLPQIPWQAWPKNSRKGIKQNKSLLWRNLWNTTRHFKVNYSTGDIQDHCLSCTHAFFHSGLEIDPWTKCY